MRDGFPVYVIDRDVDVGRSIRFLLSTLKLGCRLFESGEQFMSEIDRLPPGCILYDMGMPGLDGAALKERLARRGIDWPVILMAQSEDVPQVARAVWEGPTEFVVKPFSDVTLLNALHRTFVRLGGGQEAKAAAAR